MNPNAAHAHQAPAVTIYVALAFLVSLLESSGPPPLAAKARVPWLGFVAFLPRPYKPFRLAAGSVLGLVPRFSALRRHEPDRPLGRLGQRHQFAHRIQQLPELLARVGAEHVRLISSRSVRSSSAVNRLARSACSALAWRN